MFHMSFELFRSYPVFECDQVLHCKYQVVNYIKHINAHSIILSVPHPPFSLSTFNNNR